MSFSRVCFRFHISAPGYQVHIHMSAEKLPSSCTNGSPEATEIIFAVRSPGYRVCFHFSFNSTEIMFPFVPPGYRVLVTFLASRLPSSCSNFSPSVNKFQDTKCISTFWSLCYTEFIILFLPQMVASMLPSSYFHYSLFYRDNVPILASRLPSSCSNCSPQTTVFMLTFLIRPPG